MCIIRIKVHAIICMNAVNNYMYVATGLVTILYNLCIQTERSQITSSESTGPTVTPPSQPKDGISDNYNGKPATKV